MWKLLVFVVVSLPGATTILGACQPTILDNLTAGEPLLRSGKQKQSHRGLGV